MSTHLTIKNKNHDARKGWGYDLYCGLKQGFSWSEKLCDKGSVKQTYFISQKHNCFSPQIKKIKINLNLLKFILSNPRILKMLFAILSYTSLLTYSLIAFDERVTFWLQCVRSLPCECAYVASFARRHVYNHYAIAHVYNAANTHAQGSDLAR